MKILEFLRLKSSGIQLQEFIDKGATILDVRSEIEFKNGHLKGSKNIPLQQLPIKLNEVENMYQPIIVCCASGVRSSQAKNILTNAGFECINGGSWKDLKQFNQ